jgi:predicted TIM-barrel fold metal-dependent hydrolase
MSSAAPVQGVVDLDVHTHVEGTHSVLLPYMSSGWQQRFADRAKRPLPVGGLRAKGPVPRENPAAAPGEGRTPGSDPRFVIDQHLEPNDISVALLLSLQAGTLDGLLDAGEAAVLAAALNDYHLEHWVGYDDRFRLAGVVPPQDPHLAAAEVRRLAEQDGVAAIWLPLIDRLLGAPHYDPILAAVAESGLPLIIHPNTSIGHVWGTPLFAGGIPESQPVRYSLISTIAIANISSLIWEGVFERYPSLQVVFAEFGWTWFPNLLWKMDAGRKVGRRTMPWMKKTPREYVLEHIRLTTGPSDFVPNAEWENRTVASIHGEQILLYGSDYPHWLAKPPSATLQGAPDEVRTRVLRDNALETLGQRIRSPAGA